MAVEGTSQAQEPSEKPVLPLGYFACRKRITLFKDFQDLIRHRARWGLDIPFARPIERFIPRDTKPEYRYIFIDRAINKLVLSVSVLLKQAGVNTVYVYSQPKPQYPFNFEPKLPEVEKTRYDIILQYFDIEKTDVGKKANFDAVMRALDQGIGAYEFRKKTAFWEIFNPAMWCAHLIRLPMWILQRSGFAPSQKFYEGFIKALILIILGSIAVRFGLITWKDLTTHLFK
ncbi:MAG: hypothetical protein ACREO5_00290 [Candidatus Binatia bacterium]